MASAMRDVISAAAGMASFAADSARDLVQYMVRRGQMTQEEADKLIREAEEAAGKRNVNLPLPPSKQPKPPAPVAPPIAVAPPVSVAPAAAPPVEVKAAPKAPPSHPAPAAVAKHPVKKAAAKTPVKKAKAPAKVVAKKKPAKKR